MAHADLPAEAWAAHAEAALRRLSRALPPDIRVRAIDVAPDGFDARFSALWRRYAYRVCDDPARADPLRRRDTLWNPRPLDLGAMNEAAARLLGEHDFAAFCRKREGATTVRALRRLEWARDADGVAVGCVVADAFCHNMVRALVGALLPVGEGSRPSSWPAEVLAAAARDPARAGSSRARPVPGRGRATRPRTSWRPAPPSPAASGSRKRRYDDARTRPARGARR